MNLEINSTQAQLETGALDLASHKLERLGGDGELALYRAHPAESSKSSASVLVVVPLTQPSAAALRRMRHEYALRDQLDGASAVRPLALAQLEGRSALVLEDPGGMPLDRLLSGPMQIARFLRLAAAIAGALGQLHNRGLVHKDVKPANILVDAAGGRVWLTGLGLASRLPRERQSPAPPELIAGTLAYMAPEQTGRMNRSVDSRSDLYALGVTLYEMLTGSLPFNATEPMEWVHCHIARTAVPPHERCADVPPAVSAIVMKLLAKTPEERYQTAAGVEHDLRRCLASWESQQRIDAIALGEHDTPDRLVIPEQLYGRSNEVAALLAAFERVVSSGRLQLVLIAGYSGIGKSSVVNELHRVLVPARGLFASAKFDQYQRDIPYATLVQAFQGLVRPLLAKSEAELAGWREALQQALGSNARLVVDLVPEVKLIIGEPAPVTELPPQDAQRRFQLVLRRFIGVFARAEHPLALFLDDLQWLDAATLDLIEDLMTQPDVRHLLLIGAYRDNEVGALHPLQRKLVAIRQAQGAVQQISLGPLAGDDVGQLVADALRCERAHAMPLAQLVYEKTGGNPFFVIQFLSALVENGLLYYDHADGRWSWDRKDIHAQGYTDNVVELVVGRLARLGAPTQEALRQLACLSSNAELTRLSLILETSEDELHAQLADAVAAELVERQDSAYRFIHDRVREAAYSLIPEDVRAAAHLRIGRLLYAHTPADKREESIFEIVGQLNRGTELIDSPEEREQLAQLNLLAGKRAKAAAAYASALKYLAAGADHLANGAWERRHELSFALELNRAECEVLTGARDAAEKRLHLLANRAREPMERAAVACLRVALYTAIGASDRAIDVGLDYLQAVGIQWTAHPSDDDLRREYALITSSLRSRSIEALIELPLMNDRVGLATLDVLTALYSPAMYTDANLAALTMCRAVNLSLEGGNSDGSCFAYVMLGSIAGGFVGDYDTAFRFAQVGYELAEKRGLKRFQARTCLNFAVRVLPWRRPVADSRHLVSRAFALANSAGDLIFATNSGNAMVTVLLAAGAPLAEVQEQAEHALAFAQGARFGIMIDIIRTQSAFVRTLRGLTANLGSFDDEQYNELDMQRRFSAGAGVAFAESWYWVRKLQAAFLACNYAAAIDALSHAQGLMWASGSLFQLAEYHFYAALARAAGSEVAAEEERRQHLDALAVHHGLLQAWADACPENFENRAALVGAEIARLEGRELDAQRLYEQAIRSARANGFVHNEALAYELAARFYAARGFEEITRLYLRNARRCYASWGADGKVRQLDELHPHLRPEEAQSGAAGTIAAPVEHLDLATVLKVSQAVSGEFVLDKLIDKLMRTALEHAGAQRGLLIDSREGVLHLEAQAVTSGNDIIVHRTRDPIETVGLSRSIVNYVSRTNEVAIFDTAERASPFYDDEYVRDSHVRSILCLPLIKQGQVVALLYLENSLAARVFTPATVAVLRLLASEAATALENSRLYRELQEREGKVRRLVDSSIIGVVIADLDGAILEANEAFLGMLGYSQDDLAAGRLRWADITPVEWLAANQRAWEQTRAVGRCEAFEKEYFHKDGSRVRVLVGGAAFDDTRTKAISFVLDLTERKRAEEERRAHVWFLESMDRINRAIQGSNDLERMMSDVLDAVLERFACDRAWLLYPCDPDAPSWRAVMEHTRPEYPGAFALGVALPADADTAAIFAAARASPGPVRLGAGYELRIPGHVAERFTIRSAMAMALCPKGDRPYLFGVHQCSHPRMWTNDEQRLFEEIGHRLTDALTSLVSFRGLRESEARLDAAQRVAHVGWWERDYATGHVSLSDEAIRIFGVQPVGLPEWQGRWVSLIHPEDRERVAAASEAALRAGPRYDVEYRVVRPDGTVRMVHSQGDVTRDDAGRPLGQFGVMQDITELRQTERRLEEAQRMARVGWWERDLVAGRVAFSDQVWEFYGIPVQDRLADLAEWKRRLPALIHEDDREKVLGAYEVSIAGGHRVEVIYRAVRPDGTMRVGRGWGDTMLDEAGRPLRQFGVVQDITELWQAEQELRASEARFRTFVDHATDAFFLQDDQGNVIDINRRACESLGYSREELSGMRPRDIDAALDEAAHERLAEQTRRGETVTFDTLHRRKDGSVFPVEIRTHQFRQGEQTFYLSLARDISERKRAEDERRAHVWFLESMDRINRAIQGTNDLERMMSEVLDVLLDIFACDRAWLIYPCDPHAPSWRTVMERTRPQFPGALALNAELPTDTDKAAVFASALASSAPVLLVPGTVAKRLAIRSQIAMAVHPKVDQPYLFGLHQCSYERVWTEPEKRLFREVGARLADALTSLLVFRTLRESEHRLEEAQRIAHVGYWERDLDSGYTTVSAEACRIFGLQLDEGQTSLTQQHERFLELVHPEDRPRTAQAAAIAQNGGPRYDVEYRLVRPDGDVRIVHSRGEVTRDESGRPRRLFGMMQDITDLRHAEQELRASEERFRTLVQFSFDGYWETDAQHRFTRQEYMEGLADAPKPGSETGKTRWELPYLEPDEEAWRKYRATLDAHLPFRDFEIARPAPDNRKRYVSVSGLPMFDETGRFIGYRGVGRDISERKRAEQELQRLHLHLVHMSRVMTTAELATSIAHEVNQPLGSILASVGPCLRWLNAQPPDLASASRALERIATDAERASQVISRIRALVRREPPRHERVDVNQVISEVIALTRDQMHSHDVALRSELAADLIVVHGDRVQLQQVILNLIANAIEAMSTIRDRRRQLAIVSANDSSGVRVEVRDCGPGVDPDGAERIFEPFYTTKADGIGMGLWICRSIIEAHGGRLWVTPNPPRGAAFQFSLPGRKLKAESAARQGRRRRHSSRSEGRAD